MKFWPLSFPDDQEFCYAWCRKQTYLYIGSTTNGRARFFGRHHKVGRIEPILVDDCLFLWLPRNCSNLELEMSLIKTYCPRYNTNYPSMLFRAHSILAPDFCINPTELPLCKNCHVPYSPSGRGNFTWFCSKSCRDSFFKK